jgi:uncharacterized membrane protein YgdD (TMEM256/DUF423 family)
MKSVFGSIFIILGIFAAAGSAGDCDGKCMEYANSLTEMLTVAFFGILAVAIGSYLVYSDNV